MKQKVLLFLSFILCSLFMHAQPNGWQYRMPITITNNGSTPLYNVTIPVYVNTQTLVASNQMQASGSDIRFGTPCTGLTLFPFYIDSGMNSTQTKILLNLDTLLGSASRTIFMFYGNSLVATGSAATTLIFQNGPISAINSLSPSGSITNSSNCQRGFAFSTNQEIMVTSFGKNTPNSTTRYLTLFDGTTHNILLQDTVSGAASTYSYQPLSNNYVIQAGVPLVLELFQGNGDNYYYQISTSIASQLTYTTMRYCNTCTQNTWPTNTLNGYQYGFPDMQFYTVAPVSPMPTITVGVGSSAGNPPHITTQPLSTSACVGNSTSFSVSATGTGLNYQWQLNTGYGFTNLINNATYSNVSTNTLNITNVNASMNGYQYRCFVANDSCADTVSAAATLNINTIPVIVSQPLSASICPSGVTGYSIIATGSGLTYQWQVNTGSGWNNITNGGVYSNATTSNLTLTGATSTMAGYNYRCIVSGTCTPSVTSNVVTLTIYTSPNITFQPQNDTACEGTTSAVYMYATGSSVHYQWQLNTGSGWNNLLNGGGINGALADSMVIIYTPLSWNNAFLRCYVNSGGCAPTLYTDSVKMVVHALPAAVTQPSSTGTCAGNTALFYFNAVGYGLTYQWQVNTGGSTWTNLSTNAYYSGVNSDSLSLVNVPSTFNNYNYRCVLSGTCNVVSNTYPASLSINNPPTASFTVNGSTSFCPGDSVLFIAAQNPNYSYQWQQNGVNIPNATGVTYTVFNSGTYSLNVSLSGNCSQTSTTQSINILSAPPASISAGGPTTFCQGGSVNLNANTGSGLSYIWYLNGLVISGATSSTYTATVSGNYKVDVYNGTCHTQSSLLSVTVNPNPVAQINYTGTGYFCSGTPVTLSATTASGNFYQWYNNGNPIGGAVNSTYSTSNNGIYTVKVSNTFGCTDSSNAVSLTSVPIPPAYITASGSTTICNGNSVTLNAPTGTDLVYQWYLNGNLITGGTNNTYAATAAGSYTVVITNMFGQGCAVTSNAIVVIVNAVNPPPASITYSGNPIICYGSTLTLNANNGYNLTYQWYVDSTIISGATSSTYAAYTSGNYQVLVTNAGGCYTTSAVIALTVDTPLNPTIYANGNVLRTGSGYTSYRWYKNGTFIGGATSYSYNTGGAPGTYTVLVKDPAGCSKLSAPYNLVGLGNLSTNNNIKIYPNPASSFINVEADVVVNVVISTLEGKQMMSVENAKNINIQNLANGLYMIQVYDIDNNLLLTEKLIKNNQ